MVLGRRQIAALLCCAFLAGAAAPSACAQGALAVTVPEQRRIEVRSPAQLPRARIPDIPAPPTVNRPEPERPKINLSLDEALRIALRNSAVVRVLTGTGATSSGRTVYDPAIANTQVDVARGRFDPSLAVGNTFDQIESPQAAYVPSDPTRAEIFGNRVNTYDMATGLAKTTATGGTASLSVAANPLQTTGQSPLNPQTPASTTLQYSQPLLQGGGWRANLAPIELARIDTEGSFYDLKSSVQQMVGGVIEAYWALVFARTEVWARQQQVDQGTWAYELAAAKLRQGLGDAGEVAQARSSLAGFRANLITAEAALLRREAALRNILGLPPSDGTELVPTTPPTFEWFQADWQAVLATAEQYRPDLVALKLAIEANQQQLLIARNQALPRTDATALYRWNGLDGLDPSRRLVATRPGEFASWQLGIDVSMPLGLRQARAELRRQELLLARDRANLDQGLHNAAHLLADVYRNLAQYYRQYEAFLDTRNAARMNLDAQAARWSAGLTIYLNVLQAITSWGDSVDAEAQALLQYNTALANLSEQTGTILEDHGIRFAEELYCSRGPSGLPRRGRCYPEEMYPTPNESFYPRGERPAEEAFDLTAPDITRRRGPRETLQPPQPRPPGGQGPMQPEPPGAFPPNPQPAFPEPIPVPSPQPR